jgi:hypothetical protein
MVLIFHAAAQRRNARLGSGSLRIRRAAAPPRENISYESVLTIFHGINNARD